MGTAQDNHKVFRERLRLSELAKWRIGQWFADRGCWVRLSPVKVAPTAAQWRAYADNGDLYITMRVEVKHLGYNFTSLDDWPFKDFMLCSKNAHDRADPKPFAYINLNPEMTHAAVVFSWDQASWTAEWRIDPSFKDHKQEHYMAPFDCVHFAPLEKPKDEPGQQAV